MISLDTVLKDFHSIVIDDGGASVTVDASQLDIDDLDHAVDSVKIGDGTDFLAIAADGSIAVTDNGGSLTVDGTVELGATTLAALETITVDSITNPVAVTDNGGSLTVDGSVSVSNLNMYAEDSAHVSGDMGMMPLAVRSDSPVSLVSAAGDYSPLAVTSNGKLWVSNGAEKNNASSNTSGFAMGVAGWDGTNQYTLKTDTDGHLQIDVLTMPSVTVTASDLDIRDLSHSQDSVKIGDGTDFLAINGDGSINAQFTEAGYSSWSVIQATVDTTVGGTQIAASPLSNRLRIEIQNLGANDVYIKEATGVTSANGFKISKGSSWEMSLDAGAAVWAIAASGTTDLRINQFAA